MSTVARNGTCDQGARAWSLLSYGRGFGESGKLALDSQGAPRSWGMGQGLCDTDLPLSE